MDFIHTMLEPKWIIGIILTVGGIWIKFTDSRKKLSDVDKDVYALLRKLIETIDDSILEFKQIGRKDEFVNVLPWSGNLFQIGNLESHVSDELQLYTSDKLYFNHDFIYQISSSILPERIANALLKLQDWNTKIVSETKLKNYVLAGSKEKSIKKYDVKKIYKTEFLGVEKKELYDKNSVILTVVYNGTFKDYRKNCKNLCKEIERWLRKKNIKDINQLIFKQKLNHPYI